MTDCIKYKRIERAAPNCAIFDDEARAIVWFNKTRRRTPGDGEIYKLERVAFSAQYYVPLVICDECG